MEVLNLKYVLLLLEHAVVLAFEHKVELVQNVRGIVGVVPGAIHTKDQALLGFRGVHNLTFAWRRS